jgi:hypothetical protein
MDAYLREFRTAENEMRKLAALLLNPELKARFLAEHKDFSEAKYDAAVARVKAKASYYYKAAWVFEKAYADKYGTPRQEYGAHLVVREMAREIRREMEKSEGRTPPAPVHRRGPEKPAFAHKEEQTPVSKETHELVVSFAQELRRKYSDERPKYRRGYDRVGGQKYINIAARDRDEEERSRYHRGERRIISDEERTMIARREVPKKTEAELSERKIARLDLDKPRTWKDANAQVRQARKERDSLDAKIASLSGEDKRKAIEERIKLNQKIFRLRRMRDSLA